MARFKLRTLTEVAMELRDIADALEGATPNIRVAPIELTVDLAICPSETDGLTQEETLQEIAAILGREVKAGCEITLDWPSCDFAVWLREEA